MDGVKGHRSSLKQQNKPFKGKKSEKSKGGRVEAGGTHVAEWTEQNKQARKNAAAQKRKSHRENLTNKIRGLEGGQGLKVVAVLALHSDADSQNVIETLKEKCELLEKTQLHDIFKLPDGTKAIFLNVPRNELSVLDFSKISDCFIFTFSCKNADLSKAKLDPSSCSAFDETGYKLLSALKTQGFPQVIGTLQDLAVHSTKKQKEAKKLFSRYYSSEVPEGAKLQPLFKSSEILQQLSTSLRNSPELPYKSFRSYFYVHNINTSNGICEFTGVIKGTGILNVNQLVHVTGIGDFNIHSLVTPNGEFLPTNPESLASEKEPGPFAAEQTWPGEDELAEAFSRLEVKTDHKIGDEMEDLEGEDELVMSDEEKQPFQFEERKKEDLDFPDEVDTPTDQLAKVRFQKFRGLASFRTSAWDKYENLPPEYSRIYEFKEPCSVVKKFALEQTKDCSQTCTDMLVTVRIANFPVHLIAPDLPVIVSSLLPHERKLSVLHFKLEHWGQGHESLLSKSAITLHYGFRRVVCNPVYSEDCTNDKYKYYKTVPQCSSFIASIFAPVSYTPANALVYRDSMEGSCLVAIGSLVNFDPSRLIIKRILLTGYPLKVLII